MNMEQKRETMRKVMLTTTGFVLFSGILKEYVLSTVFSLFALRFWLGIQALLLLIFSVAVSVVLFSTREDKIKFKFLFKKVSDLLLLELLVVGFGLLAAVCAGGVTFFCTLLFPSLLSQGKMELMVDIIYFLTVLIALPLVIHLFAVHSFKMGGVGQTLLFAWKTFHVMYWKLFWSVAVILALGKGLSLLQNVLSTAAVPWVRVFSTVTIWVIELFYLFFVYDSANLLDKNI